MAFLKSVEGSFLMNERYAVDPDAPADWRELKQLLDLVGLQSGRFLVSFPADWSLFLQQRFATASDMDRKRVVELLRRGRFSVLCDAGYKRHLDWAQNAVAAKTSLPNTFKEIIAATGNNLGLKTLKDVFYEEGNGWPSGVGDHVNMVASDYARCASPLFELSAEITLVDRFFKLRSESGQRDHRRINVLQAFFKLAAVNRGFQCIRLVLELPKDCNQSRYELDLEKDIEYLLSGYPKADFSVEFDVRSSVGHGRYLFSIHGGLHFDHGFDEKQGQTNHVHWLSSAELKPLIDRYVYGSKL